MIYRLGQDAVVVSSPLPEVACADTSLGELLKNSVLLQIVYHSHKLFHTFFFHDPV